MKMKERFWTPPNVLSLYRILVFPFILFLIFDQNEKWFTIFICINLVSDVLDGFLARNFNWQTEIGAKLDSYGDIGTYICAFIGIFVFKWTEIADHSWLLFIFLGLYIFMHLFALIKFKRSPSFHLYLFKSNGYVQGSFFFVLFVFGYFPIYFFIAMGIGILAVIEEIIIIAILKELRSNVKGLYWILKEKKH